MAKCLRCGLETEEQIAKRRANMQGVCYPGRCVVKGSDGLPLYSVPIAANCTDVGSSDLLHSVQVVNRVAARMRDWTAESVLHV